MEKCITTFNNIVLTVEQHATGPGPAFDHYMDEIGWAYDPDTLSKFNI